MLKCNKVIETTLKIPKYMCMGGEARRYFIKPQVEVWVIIDENEKYLGTILLHLPLEKEDSINVVLNLRDVKLFAGCFDVIQKEYPENAFEIQIPFESQKEYFPYIVEEANFIALKTATEEYASFYYANNSQKG